MQNKIIMNKCQFAVCVHYLNIDKVEMICIERNEGKRWLRSEGIMGLRTTSDLAGSEESLEIPQSLCVLWSAQQWMYLKRNNSHTCV